MNRLRMLAEWESYPTILMALPCQGTDWEYCLDEVQDCYYDMIKAFTDAGLEVYLLVHPRVECPERFQLPGVRILNIPYNDTWTRDYGPITLSEYPIDFQFNGWGLKFAADCDNMVNHNLSKRGVKGFDRLQSHLSYELEGGSIETDGNGTILTTSRCLLSPNRNGFITKQKVEEYLREVLGAERVLWLDHGGLQGDDTDGHIDTLVRILPGNRIIYVSSSDPQHPDYEELKAMERELQEFRTSEGEPYTLIPLPLPTPIVMDDEMLPATYANYLVAPRHIFLPVYGDEIHDSQALKILAEVWPDREIVPVNCRALIRQHGSLHCATMQVYNIDNNLNSI